MHILLSSFSAGMWSRFGKKSSEPVSSELKVIQKWDKDSEMKTQEEEPEPVKITAKAGDEIDATGTHVCCPGISQLQ